MAKLGLRDGEKIAHPLISNALARAQQKVESRNFDIRKNLLKFDNVMNDQRKVIYEQRREIMASDDVSATIRELRNDVIQNLVAKAIPLNSYIEQWDITGLHERVQDILGLDLPIADWAQENGVTEREIEERLHKAAEEKVTANYAALNDEARHRAEKAALLAVLDQAWKDHLLGLDQLRQGIHLRGYGQRDPLNEYNREAFGLFHIMMDHVREQVTRTLMRNEVRLPSLDEILAARRAAMESAGLQELHAEPESMSSMPEGNVLRHPGADRRPPLARPVHNTFNQNDPNTWINTPRNATCPCGSGKKYKHCHGGAG